MRSLTTEAHKSENLINMNTSEHIMKFLVNGGYGYCFVIN